MGIHSPVFPFYPLRLQTFAPIAEDCVECGRIQMLKLLGCSGKYLMCTEHTFPFNGWNSAFFYFLCEKCHSTIRAFRLLLLLFFVLNCNSFSFEELNFLCFGWNFRQARVLENLSTAKCLLNQ